MARLAVFYGRNRAACSMQNVGHFSWADPSYHIHRPGTAQPTIRRLEPDRERHRTALGLQDADDLVQFW